MFFKTRSQKMKKKKCSSLGEGTERRYLNFDLISCTNAFAKLHSFLPSSCSRNDTRKTLAPLFANGLSNRWNGVAESKIRWTHLHRTSANARAPKTDKILSRFFSILALDRSHVSLFDCFLVSSFFRAVYSYLELNLRGAHQIRTGQHARLALKV